MSNTAREFNKPEEHYTAIVEIHRVKPEQVVKNNYNDVKTIAKEKYEVARIVIRSETIGELKKKLEAHVNLVEDN